MTAMQRRKGATAEVAVVNYMRTVGFPNVERRLSGAGDDIGDLTGIPGITHEIKNHRGDSLPAWVDQLANEIDVAGTQYGAVIHKRRGKPDPGEWFATMTLDQWCRLLVDLGYGATVTTQTDNGTSL